MCGVTIFFSRRMSSPSSPLVPQQPAVSNMMEPPSSISSLTKICLREFLELIELSKSVDNASEIGPNLQDELGRLRVWIGNLGAHRKQADRLSLDHRLREAPGLHSQVRNHITALIEAVQEVTAVISRTTIAAESSDNSSSEEDDSDIDEEWQRFKEEENDYCELDECLLDIRHTITSLYKLSLTLQNPARRDRTDKAARIDLCHFEFFDIQHASNMFGIPRESVLAQRLGKANTKRRQLLAYHQDHSDQISKYVDVALEKARIVPQKGPKSISTKWTQDTTISTVLQSPHASWTHNTTISTVLQSSHAISDCGRTSLSITTSTANDQPTASIPPPPREAKAAENEPFFCPYCCQTVQLENLDTDWKYHVLSDLRPYICTFGGCVKANQLYDSFTEWSEHERQFHRRQLSCSLCSYTSRSADDFRAHLQNLHADVIAENQLQTITEASWKPITTSQQCPLCTTPPMADQRRFQQHLARHLQKLALFVLPRSEPEDESQPLERGSNESLRVVMMDDEELSLSSTSIHETRPIAKDTKPDEYSSTLGWWVCCQCADMSNSQLAPTRCSVCSHYRCDTCENPQSMGLESDSDYGGGVGLPEGSVYGSEDEIRLGQQSRGSSSGFSWKQRSGNEGIHGDKIFDDFRQGADDAKTTEEEAMARWEKVILYEDMERTKRQAAAEAATKPTLDQNQTIMFKDHVGRSFNIPLVLCRTWKEMDDLIVTSFQHDKAIGPHVAEGHYDLVGPNGEIILPHTWDKVIEPGWTITMDLWPGVGNASYPLVPTNPPKPADDEEDDYGVYSTDTLAGLDDYERETKRYQAQKSGRTNTMPAPAEALLIKSAVGAGSDNGSQKSGSKSSFGSGSGNGESKNMNLMINGLTIGFNETSVAGKNITIRAGDNGRVQLSIAGDRPPTQDHVSGSSYSDQTGLSDRGELEEAPDAGKDVKKNFNRDPSGAFRVGIRAPRKGKADKKPQPEP